MSCTDKMPPVTIGYATSGGVRQLCCTGCLGNSMAFGLAVKDFGAKPFAKITTGATASSMHSSQTYIRPEQRKSILLAWQRLVPCVASLCQCFHWLPGWPFPCMGTAAWQPVHTSKLSPLSTPKTLGHLVQSWLALLPFCGQLAALWPAFPQM